MKAWLQEEKTLKQLEWMKETDNHARTKCLKSQTLINGSK